MTLAIISLVVSISCYVHVVIVSRRTKRQLNELERLMKISNEAYIQEQTQRWLRGEIKSRIEKGVGVCGTDVEVIEPMPGVEIVVGTVKYGKSARKQA